MAKFIAIAGRVVNLDQITQIFVNTSVEIPPPYILKPNFEGETKKTLHISIILADQSEANFYGEQAQKFLGVLRSTGCVSCWDSFEESLCEPYANPQNLGDEMYAEELKAYNEAADKAVRKVARKSKQVL